MLVTYAWCHLHGRSSTALLEADGLRRCDVPVDGHPCDEVLTLPGGSELDRELLLVREGWPRGAPDGR